MGEARDVFDQRWPSARAATILGAGCGRAGVRDIRGVDEPMSQSNR
jgi:hypothetical protein